MTHDETKKLYLAYRETAKQLIASEPHVDPTHLTVSNNANVQLCEDGAFVEINLWIPKEAL